MSPLAIRCQQLEKHYPPDVRAVDGLDLEVLEGECFGLLGPNGAGKTTTIEILEGLLEPTSGDVTVLGRQWSNSHRELRQKIGISLQETRFPEKLRVLETITLFRNFYRSGYRPGEILALVGLEDKALAWVGNLSGGQKQRLEIACALVGKPSLIFLDEPTTGLDPRSRRSIWGILRHLRSEGRTIIITTHYMDEAERLCDRVAIIDRGRVIALGTPRELIARLKGDHVIEFAARSKTEEETNGGAAMEADTIGSLPGVQEVRIDERRATLTVAEPHVTLPALLEYVHRTDRVLTRLETRHASLEDVFVKLTGRYLDASHE